MAKKYNYNSDWMSRQMDEKLEKMEDRLSSIYANASYDVNAEFAKFAKTFEKEDKQKYAEMQEGVISKEEYSLWRQRHILQTDLYKATVDKITGTLVNTDVMAMALVNGELPSVVSQSYNFVQSLGWKEADESGLSVGTFQIYNADAVQAILKDNPDLLPVVDVPEDKKWNKEKINDTIASSIIKGDPIDKVAENLQKVANMDHNSAVRNARTAMTGAENLGRTQSASDLKAKGIPMDEVWSATYDDRVRASHLMLDGTKRDENGVFGADFLSTPLRYPADPNGDPEEIYNCRCRLNVVLAGIDHSQDDDLYEQFMKENYAESWQKMQENEGYKEKERQKEDALARKERLLEQKAEKQAQEQSNVPLEVETKSEVNQNTDLSKMSNSQTNEWFTENSNYKDWKEDILDKEYDDTINKYTGEYYWNANNYLRTGEFNAPNKWFDESDMNKMIKELDESIGTFNLESPIVVYRSSTEDILGLKDASLEDIKSKIGETVIDKAYLSTSTLKEIPDEQTVGGKILYEIAVPAGQGNGAYIQSYSENPQEREFLIKRDSQYEVMDVREEDGKIVVKLNMV